MDSFTLLSHIHCYINVNCNMNIIDKAASVGPAATGHTISLWAVLCCRGFFWYYSLLIKLSNAQQMLLKPAQHLQYRDTTNFLSKVCLLSVVVVIGTFSSTKFFYQSTSCDSLKFNSTMGSENINLIHNDPIASAANSYSYSTTCVEKKLLSMCTAAPH